MLAQSRGARTTDVTGGPDHLDHAGDRAALDGDPHPVVVEHCPVRALACARTDASTGWDC